MPTRRADRVPEILSRSRRQEAALAVRVGGVVTRGSGNGIMKGDVRVKGIVRIEAKSTKKKSFSITQDMITKIEHAAISAGELPVVVVEFVGGGKTRTVCVVPMWVLDMLTGGNDDAS